MHFSTLFGPAFAGAALAAQIFVDVSNKAGDLVFNPDTIQAAQNDMVTFRFLPRNHSVAQAAFGSPCQPLSSGFWSGYVPSSSTQSYANTTFTYTVTNASAPVWFYCSQGQHCQQGMVGVINPPKSGDNTLTAFKNAAMSASGNVAPSSTAGTGGTIGQLSSNSSSASSTSSSMPSSSSSPTSSASSSAPPPSRSSSAASSLTGNMAFAGLTGLLTFFWL